MLKPVVSLLLAGLANYWAYDYKPTSLFELALQADIVVDGSVVRTGREQGDLAKVFVIAINEVIIGKDSRHQLEIMRFVDSPCASRYAPYEADQRAVFFLAYQRDRNQGVDKSLPMKVLGVGNDGECPLLGQDVLHVSFGWECPDCKVHSVFGHEYSGLATPRKEFVDAVRGIRGCFEWKRGRTAGAPFPLTNLNRKCSAAELVRLRESSFTAGQFCDGVFSRDLQERIQMESSK